MPIFCWKFIKFLLLFKRKILPKLLFIFCWIPWLLGNHFLFHVIYFLLFAKYLVVDIVISLIIIRLFILLLDGMINTSWNDILKILCIWFALSRFVIMLLLLPRSYFISHCLHYKHQKYYFKWYLMHSSLTHF